jgi:hypothetical protein
LHILTCIISKVPNQAIIIGNEAPMDSETNSHFAKVGLVLQ